MCPYKKKYLKSDYLKQFSCNYHVDVPFSLLFNMHYVNSIFQFNLRIFTKHVRGLLSSILNALHHGIIPCALAHFFAFEQSAAILSQRAVQAERVAREAAADAQKMKNAHATIVSQHQKMFLQTAFSINPDGTPITDLSLCPDKLKKCNSAKSVNSTPT